MFWSLNASVRLTYNNGMLVAVFFFFFNCCCYLHAVGFELMYVWLMGQLKICSSSGIKSGRKIGREQQGKS